MTCRALLCHYFYFYSSCTAVLFCTTEAALSTHCCTTTQHQEYPSLLGRCSQSIGAPAACYTPADQMRTTTVGCAKCRPKLWVNGCTISQFPMICTAPKITMHNTHTTNHVPCATHGRSNGIQRMLCCVSPPIGRPRRVLVADPGSSCLIVSCSTTASVWFPGVL